MTLNETSVDVAVFFDFENIVFSVRNNYNINANFEDLMDKCKEFGRIVVARAFADWNRQSSVMIPALISNGFDPVYVPSFHVDNNGKQELRKNAVDMYMAIDAMDVLHSRKNVDTFILLTGDSDFLPLVNAIRREGKKVIAVGVDGSSSSHLGQAVDEFIFYSQVSPLPSQSKQQGRPKDIYEGLTRAIKRLQSQGKSTVLPNVKMMMGELMGGFDEKKHNDRNGKRYQKFKEFVQEGERRNLVRLVTTGSVNEVFLKESKSGSRSASGPTQKQSDKKQQKTPKKKSDAPKAREQESKLMLEDAFELLQQAVANAEKEKNSTRPTAIKKDIKKLNENFDVNQIDMGNQKPLSRFGDFVNLAEKEGVIQISGKGSRRQLKSLEAKTHDQKSQNQAEQKVEKEAKPAQASNGHELEAELQPITEVEAKGLIVEGLQNFNAYPAPFLKIEAHCRHIRNERRIYLPSPKVRALLTEATREMGLLVRVSPPGVSPAQYELNKDGKLFDSYLGKTAVTADQPLEATQEKPADKASEPTVESPEALAFGLLVKAVQKANSEGKSSRLSAIKNQMVRLDKGFNEKELVGSDGKNYKRFVDFAKAAEQAGLVTLTGKGIGTQIGIPE